MEVTLFNFVETNAGTYSVAAGILPREFNGQVLDVGGVVRNLLSGTVTLGEVTAGTVDIAVNAEFSQGIVVRAAGTVPVRTEYAP